MCGIVGILSCEENWHVKSVLYESISELLNRGYDSMGVSLLIPTGFHRKRSLQKEIIFDFLKQETHNIKNGIAHTRWATHGGVTIENAHPHIDTMETQIAIVHNGIIENYQEQKDFLIQKNIVFSSETDSEVIVNLIAFHYTTSTTPNVKTRLMESIIAALEKLEGTYGIIVQSTLLPDHLFCARRGSPILIGINKEKTIGMIVSEKSGFLHYIQEYVSLEDNCLYCVHHDNNHHISYHCFGENCGISSLYKNEHDHGTVALPAHFRCFTEKEIWEQPEAIQRTLGHRLTSGGYIKFGGLESLQKELYTCSNIFIFGSGTSYHVAMMAMQFFKTSAHIDLCLAFDASEFSLDDLPNTRNTKSACIYISQSGETLDLYSVLRKLQSRQHFFHLGIINVVDSLIARSVDAGVYMNCGKERGVASTKSFTSSAIISWMMAHWFSLQPVSRVSEIRYFPVLVKEFLDKHYHEWTGIAATTFHYSSILILGKGIDLYIAKEASLKIKELAYIHAEAYSSTSLKHGPFALLDKNILVFFVATDQDSFQKSRNALYEVTARNVRTIVVCTPSFEIDYQLYETILVPEHPLAFLLANIVFQSIALEMAFLKNNNPDFPRNLAKVVTVE